MHLKIFYIFFRECKKKPTKGINLRWATWGIESERVLMLLHNGGMAYRNVPCVDYQA